MEQICPRKRTGRYRFELTRLRPRTFSCRQNPQLQDIPRIRMTLEGTHWAYELQRIYSLLLADGLR